MCYPGAAFQAPSLKLRLAASPRACQPICFRIHPGDAGYDILVINGLIEHELFAKIAKCLAQKRKSKKVVVALVTYGGQANVAYRISRLLQGMYEDIVVFIPSFCKSAGTLIATCANSLMFSPFGEIGPLDVQLVERDELGERKSGLTMRSALEDLQERSFELFETFMLGIKGASGNNVTFKLAAEVARDATIGLMGNIYDQVHPDVLGKDYRDLSVATKYGERLNKKFGNVRDEGLHQLVHGYPSHDFVIDCDEASEIFRRVELAPSELLRLIEKHGNKLMVPNVKDFDVELETWPDEAKAEGGEGEANDNRNAAEDADVAAE